MSAKVKTKAWFVRWQEPIFWLPLLTIVCIAAWMVLGALDERSVSEMLSPVMEVPIRCLLAYAWLHLVYLTRRRFRRKLTDEEQAELWAACMRSERGPLLLYLSDVGVWILAGAALLPFFLL